jgi:hypothetical protein
MASSETKVRLSGFSRRRKLACIHEAGN